MKSFHSLKGGARKVLPCLEGGGGAKSFGPAIFPFCSPPLPVINDQSLVYKVGYLTTVHFGYSGHLGPSLSGHYIRLATISDLKIIE